MLLAPLPQVNDAAPSFSIFPHRNVRLCLPQGLSHQFLGDSLSFIPLILFNQVFQFRCELAKLNTDGPTKSHHFHNIKAFVTPFALADYGLRFIQPLGQLSLC